MKLVHVILITVPLMAGIPHGQNLVIAQNYVEMERNIEQEIAQIQFHNTEEEIVLDLEWTLLLLCAILMNVPSMVGTPNGRTLRNVQSHVEMAPNIDFETVQTRLQCSVEGVVQS